MSTTRPFGSVRDDSLVSENALTTGQTDLILTGEQFDRMHSTVVRRFAAALDTDEVHGKVPRFVIRAALVRQRTLGEYADG